MNGRRPLTVGETLNEVFTLYRRHLGVLIPAAFWLFLGVNVVTGIAGNDHTGLLALGAILTFAVAVLYQGMVVSLVRDVRDGTRDSSVGELISSVGPVLPSLLGASIVYAIAVAVGFLFFIIPGCILLTIWAVIAPVIVVEKSRVGGAFGRSQKLVRDHGWTVFGTVVAATLISLVAAVILTSIAEAIAGGPILRIVFSTLASTFTAPVGALVAAILYYRLREIKGDADPMMPPRL
ncbi:MAG TPA: YciC family protein [Solirubrobacterales bacterium]|nr:YciC family protein [Solirubrobacterales bacterium]